MKKVLSALVLTSFFAVLLVPITASAEPSCGSSCSVPVSVNCICGAIPGVSGGTIARAGLDYCSGNKIYYSKTDCQTVAQTPTGGPGYLPETSITTPEALVGLIDKVGGYIFMALLALAAIFLLISGWFFVTASGNPENVNKARTMLIYTMIGVAVALAARGLITIATNFVK